MMKNGSADADGRCFVLNRGPCKSRLARWIAIVSALMPSLACDGAQAHKAPVEILSMHVGRESGWKTRSGRSTTIQFVEVTFHVRSAEAVRLPLMYAYLYDAKKRLIKGCRDTKIRRFFYEGRSFSADDAKVPRFDNGKHTIKFVWNDRGSRLGYALCVIGSHDCVTARAASEEGLVALRGFAFDEQDKLGY